MQLFDTLDAPSVISVSALSVYLKELLETNDSLQNIWVHGEVSNCKTYPSGHCYFTLKEGTLNCCVSSSSLTPAHCCTCIARWHGAGRERSYLILRARWQMAIVRR